MGNKVRHHRTPHDTFDPDDLGGHYSMVWPAGPLDSHSRILNVGLEAKTAGESYFDFGDPVDTPKEDGTQDPSS
jgi:hypothetical protein